MKKPFKHIKKNKNVLQANYVNKLKAETNYKVNSELSKRYFFEYFIYFQKNERKNHQLESWLLADKLLSEYETNTLQFSNVQSISYRQVVYNLTAYLPKEILKNQLEISDAIVNYYRLNFIKDSLIKYSQLQNKFEKDPNLFNLKREQINLDLY